MRTGAAEKARPSTKPLIGVSSFGNLQPAVDRITAQLEMIGHASETALDCMREGSIEADSGNVGVLLSLLDVIRADYIRTARAKGLSEGVVIIKHAVRNALLPIVTLIGLSLPFLFSGSVLIEYVFAWPGMGRVIVEAIFTQDTPLIIACFFVFTLLVVAGNLLADIAYSVVDPRIRLS